MTVYKHNSDDSKGKIVYNAGLVRNIVELAVAEVEGTVPAQGKKGGISLFLEKDGIYVDVSVCAKKRAWIRTVIPFITLP